MVTVGLLACLKLLPISLLPCRAPAGAGWRSTPKSRTW